MTVKSDDELVMVCEWGSDDFHRRVIELEKEGYVTREGTYSIVPEINPETGEVLHLHKIEMFRQKPEH